LNILSKRQPLWSLICCESLLCGLLRSKKHKLAVKKTQIILIDFVVFYSFGAQDGITFASGKANSPSPHNYLNLEPNLPHGFMIDGWTYPSRWDVPA
jgi:hypothetical protein